MNHSLELFKKYIQGETTKLESRLVEELLETNDEYREQSVQYFLESDYTSYPQESLPEIFKMEMFRVGKKKHRDGSRIYPLLVTIFFVFLGVTFYLGTNREEVITHRWLTDIQSVNDTLPDGSVFFLNEQSSCSVREGFNDEKREIYFEGELYINVSHNKEKPFIIHTQNIDIKVLGTSFNVTSRKDQNVFSLYVETGRVSVTKNDTGEEYQVRAGDILTINKMTNKVSKNISSSNLNAWATGRYIFTDALLKDVVAIINNNSDKKFVFENDALENCSFTGNFSCNSLGLFVDVLKLSFGFEVSDFEDVYLISGQACN